MAVLDMDELLRSEKVDTAGAAAMLGVTPAQVSRMCSDGTLAAFQPGKKWLIPVVAIENLLRERFNRASKPAESDDEAPEADTPSKRALKQVAESGQ